jgi:hypothetical protein
MLENLMAYQWRVFAYNGEAWSSASDIEAFSIIRYVNIYLPLILRNFTGGDIPDSDPTATPRPTLTPYPTPTSTPIIPTPVYPTPTPKPPTFWDVGLYNPNNEGHFFVQYGAGDGTFGGQTLWTWGVFNAQVFTGDFDGDGFWDVGLYNPNNEGHFFVQYGAGDGTFGGQTLWTWGVFPSAQVFTGDFDGDGFWDVGLYNPNNLGNFYIQYGAGTGEFSGQTAWNWGVYPSAQVFTGDFDGDGFWDVGLYNPNNLGNFYIHYGTGSGEFGEQTTWHWGVFPNAQVFTGDFDGDGFWDVGLYNPNNEGHFFVQYGTGSGAFGGQTLWTWGVFPNAQVFTGDFNGE